MRPGSSAFALFAALLLVAGWPGEGSAQEAPPPTSAADIYADPSLLSQATLVSDLRAIRPGEPFQLGLFIEVPEGWHTYWENPGDAGAQATVIWEDLPAGFEISEFRWPRPERYEVPPLMSYGYGETTLLLLDVVPGGDLAAGDRIEIGGVAEWLFCDEICLFTDAPVSIELEVADGPPVEDPEWVEPFREARALLPVEDPAWRFGAWSSDDGFLLTVELPEGWTGEVDDLYFFSRDPAALSHVAPQPVFRASEVTGEAAGDDLGAAFAAHLEGDLALLLERSPYLAETPERLEGVLAPPPGTSGWGPGDPDGAPAAVEVRAPLERAPPPVLAAMDAREYGVEPQIPAPLDAGAGEEVAGGGIPALPLALALAFVGGLLLNLMPCVFPVVSLKVFGFVNQAGESLRRVRLHGLAFGAGVLLSFLALAGVLLLIRAAGSDVGWGFQLQNPLIVAGLTALLFLIGLNLLGVFEVGTSMTRLGAIGAGGGYRGSFLTGVLATIVATPCTAPFMGVAIGAAFVRPPIESLAIFGGLGLGMATPYVLLSTRPALIRRLPTPGPWMEGFRQLMAFPMFAVAIWLLWVFGLQTGIDGAAMLLGSLLLFALAGWVYGRGHRGGRAAWSTPVATVLFAGAGVLGLHGSGMAPTPAPSGTASAIGSDVAVWEEFSVEGVARHQSEGRPVFVDFTAAWCLTCQVNKRTVLSSARTERAFTEAGVALMRADWTRRDAGIAAALQDLGRSGVPVYALYPPTPGAEPVLLPEILTHQTVARALDRLADTPLMETGAR